MMTDLPVASGLHNVDQLATGYPNIQLSSPPLRFAYECSLFTRYLADPVVLLAFFSQWKMKH